MAAVKTPFPSTTVSGKDAPVAPNGTAVGKIYEIPSLQVAPLLVTITGTTPLICNRFSETAMRNMEEAQQGKAKQKKPPRDPQREFEEACYKDDEGRYCFPAIGLKIAMAKAGMRFTSEKRTELNGLLSIPCTTIPIISPLPPSMRSDKVVMGGKSQNIAYRAQFYPWKMEVPINTVVSNLSVESCLNLLRWAGIAVGLGCWRVECNGSFGQFSIENVVGA